MSEFQDEWLAATGHRPDKLGGYGAKAETRRIDFALEVLDEMRPKGMIVGMAQGWDMAVAEACYLLGIPYRAFVPFQGQESVWPTSTQMLYRNLLDKALEIFVVSPGGYDRHKMNVRNEAMVNDETVTTVLALWNGSPGGTANCVWYAQHIAAKPVINLWGRWTRWITHS